ncbi:hypothetical protein DL98DRAFT_597443 [Cadophora sp. DSE1049]|nr:hypothetical protein DL98DRAFT_597443 [Cadophora sp. DSE1049]
MKERIYLDGFEIFRKFAPSRDEILLERVTLGVSDGSKRMALIETRVQGTDDGSQQLLRYQFDNLLGSACIELDDQARIISYEEFFPFRSSSYCAVANQPK